MSTKPKTWVATFDGASARMFAADEQGRLSEVPQEAAEGSHKDADEPTTEPNHENKDAFVADLAARLAKLAQRHKFDRLVVAAEPHAMGAFRKAASKPLQQVIAAEVVKDYANTPVKQLESHLAEHL
ncbi:host attachment protein [Marinivivus vitaminiproducens]|uniref:host attachment protein n=1 Tax=Marinivivus vitaminiproducens TaxID=3035935 RepID=UPI00279C92BD|nr:host attachment protein [Geminicoccaceae bacterium SCSIO 64248]